MHNLALDYLLWLRYESWNKFIPPTIPKVISNSPTKTTKKQTSEFHTTSGQIIDRWKIYVDQSHTLPREWTLNYGTSLTYASDHNTQFYHTQNGTDMSELNTNNRYNEYTYDFYVGFSKNMGEHLSFSASITGEYYKTARYHAWAAYPTTELTYVMTPAHILQLSFTSDKSYPSYWDLSESTGYISGYEEVQGKSNVKAIHRLFRKSELYFKEQVYLQPSL